MSTIVYGNIKIPDDLQVNTLTASIGILSNGTLANGYSNNAYGQYSHAEGYATEASGAFSHTEGDLTKAYGQGSHSEGAHSETYGNYSHAEGFQTKASGAYSHAEGYGGIAYGEYSHAEGLSTKAYGYGSHVEGYGTIASASHQHVQGKWNQTSSTAIALIGNGYGDESYERSNILEVYDNYINISGVLNVTNNLSASQVTSSFYGDGTNLYNISSDKLTQLCQNHTGAPINKGKVVHISGSNSNTDTPWITLADWSSDSLSANTLGVAAQDILHGDSGIVIVQGVLTDLALSGIASPLNGQILYLSSSGDITATKPIAPNHTVTIGQLIAKASTPTNKTIYISIQNGYELSELHDVLTNGKSNGDLLAWNSGSNVWTNTKNLSGSYSVTGTLQINSILSSSQITGSFSGSGANLTNITSSNWNGGSTSWVSDIRGLFSAGTGLSYNSSAGIFSLSGLDGAANFVTSDMTASTESFILASGSLTSSIVNVQLPIISNIGNAKVYTIKNVGVGTVNILASGSNLIDGQISSSIKTTYTAYSLYGTGSNWWVF